MAKYRIVEETSQRGTVKYVAEKGIPANDRWMASVTWEFDTEFASLTEAESYIEKILPPKREIVMEYGQ